MTNTQYEMLDLVDDRDNVIGVMERGEVYAKGLDNFRVIDAFIKNKEGKLFVPRRQAHKRLFPLALDTSGGGHVSSGETYDEAFVKEAREELDIDIVKTNYKVLGTMNPTIDGVAAFMTVYEIQSDATPDYNSDDFSAHYWLTPIEIMQRLSDGDTSKENLPKILKKFYL